MAGILDILNEGGPAAPEAPIAESAGRLQQGFRAGVPSALASANQFIGGAAEALGATDAAAELGLRDRINTFAQDRYAKSGAQVAEAGRLSEGIPSWQDVKDAEGVGPTLRQAYDFSTGTFGQSLPALIPTVGASAGAALATKGKSLAPEIAGVAAYSPLAAGDQLGELRANEEGQKLTPGERLGLAAGSGVAQAAVGQIPLSRIGGKIVGNTVESAAGKTVTQLAGRGLVDAGLEGVTEGAENAIQQGVTMSVDPTKQFDLAQLEANVAGGVAAGVPMAAPGVAGELVHGKAQGIKDTLGGAFDGAKDAISGAVGAAKDAADGAVAKVDPAGAKTAALKDTVDDIPDRLNTLYDSVKTRSGEVLDNIANSQEFADAKKFAGAAGERLNQLIEQDNTERLESVKGYVSELASKALSPEQRESLTQATADLSDRGNQAIVAGIKKASDAFDTAKQHVTSFADAVGAKLESTTGVKRSEDYSGVRRVIIEDVAPILTESRPEIFNDPKLVDQLGDGLRRFVTDSQKGKAISSDVLASLIDVAGDKTVPILEAVHKSLGSLDSKTEESFYRTLNEVRAYQEADDNVLSALRKNLKPEYKRVSDAELRQESQLLSKWADAKSEGAALGPSKSAYLDAKVRSAIETRYGDKADAVFAAVEKGREKQQNALDALRVKTDDEGNILDQEGHDLTETDAPKTEMQYFGGGNKRSELMLSPEHDPGKGGFEPAAKQALNRANKYNTGGTNRFVTASEIGMDHPAVKEKLATLTKQAMAAGLATDEAKAYAEQEIDKYGMVGSEKSTSPTALSFDQLEKMTLDEGRASSPSKIATGVRGVNIDAVKVTRQTNAKYTESGYGGSLESATGRLRVARMFAEGIAAVQDHLGQSFEIPDSTVIAHRDGRGLTWGEVKNLDVRTADDKANDRDTATLVKLRAEFKKAKASLDDGAADAIRKKAKSIVERKETAKDEEATFEPPNEAPPLVEPDPFGNVHEALGGRATPKEDQNIRTDLSGLPRGQGGKGGAGTDPNAKPTSSPRTTAGTKAVRDELVSKEEAPDKIATLDNMLATENYDALTTRARVDAFLAKARKRYVQLKSADDANIDLSEVQVKALYTLKSLFGPKSNADLDAFYDGVDDAPTGAPPSPKAVAAKKAAFLERARSGDQELLEALKASTDAKGLQRAAAALNESAVGDPNIAKALDVINERLRELVANPDVAYGLQIRKYSLEQAGEAAGPINRSEVLAYINRVLGDSVQVAWGKMAHAGDFERRGGDGNVPLEDIIRLSVHALNPTTVAYHEALHALFAKLKGAGQGDITEVLTKAASTASVTNQLRELLKNEPDALKQLSDPEERAAYMYQFWAAGKLKVGEKTNSVFERIKEFIRSVLGTWSNDERALHILEYFHSGEFAKNMGDPDAVHRALMDTHRNQALTTLKRVVEPITNLGEALAVTGGQRLRDTGIPALRELAEHMKASTTDARDDAGYLPSARAERSRRMNQLGADLKPYSKAHLDEALEAMQRGVKPTSAEARAVRLIVNKRLSETLQYMKEAGVKINALGLDGSSYFPRVWDASYISSHQQQFLNMVEKYVQSGQYKGDPRALMQRLVATEGSEFSTEIDKPGNQFLKQRVLKFISHEDAAPFMVKDLYATMNSYMTQAARRAEWSRRFDDDGSGVTKLLDQARQQGATPAQLDAAKSYIRGVDGTLGDAINPTARRFFGNAIVYQNIRLLPLAIFSSVVDPVGIMVRGGTASEAFSTLRRGLRETVNNFKKDAKPDEMARFAATLGTIDDASLVHVLGASYSQGMVGDTARKINDTFFRYNLMEQFNTSMRVGATEAALGFLARHADGTASKHSGRWLSELGLTKGDIQVDDRGRVKLTEADGLSPEAAAKMKMAVNRWVDGAVLRPDAVDKPIWANDPHWALIAHLKSFVFSFHETIIKRVLHEAQAGNYSPAIALVSYVPIMIAADLAKGLIQGGGEEPSWKKNWTAGDYVWSGIERGGLLGSTQFAADMVGDIHRGGSGLGALTGPTIEQLTDAVQVLSGREEFKAFAVKSLPANALYASALKSDPTDPMFADR